MLFLIKISPITVLRKYNCIKCHRLVRNLEIPNFLKISFKYLNNKLNKKYLFKKVRKGGKGVWGNLLMPGNKIKNYFIKFLIKWILYIKNNKL